METFRLNLNISPKSEKEITVINFLSSIQRNKNKIITDALYFYIQNHKIKDKIVVSSSKDSSLSEAAIRKIVDEELKKYFASPEALKNLSLQNENITIDKRKEETEDKIIVDKPEEDDTVDEDVDMFLSAMSDFF